MALFFNFHRCVFAGGKWGAWLTVTPTSTSNAPSHGSPSDSTAMPDDVSVAVLGAVDPAKGLPTQIARDAGAGLEEEVRVMIVQMLMSQTQMARDAGIIIFITP